MKENIDPRVRSFVLPQRILWQSEGNGAPRNAEVLLRNDWSQALTNAAEFCRVEKNGAILLDFGRELHGGVQIVTGACDGMSAIHARLRFGESVSEAMHAPMNDHAVHDTEILLSPMGSQEYGQTGFRFARIDLLDDARVLDIVALRAVTLMQPRERVGSFSCSDERLNEIWKVGADTVHLCMQDFIWDGIKRDRLVWLGDLHPEVMVISTVFGDDVLVPQSLDWARDKTPLPGWMNDMMSYSMWWIFIQHDWYFHHGDREYLEAQRDYLLQLLYIFNEGIGEEGKSKLAATFLDWASVHKTEAVDAGVHALLSMAMERGAILCDILDEPAAADRARLSVQRLRVAMPQLPTDSKQASALMALAYFYDATEVNARVLADDPLEGLSTFYGYYVLQARAAAGDYAGALDVIRKYWGGMLDIGATSFWEHFDVAWLENASRIDELPKEGQRDLHKEYGDHCYVGHRHSFCHGWAAGPTAWLSEHVLGIRPLEVGCARVLVVPHMEDLEWTEGTFPTPHGTISVRHEKVDGETISRIDAPSGVEIVRE